MRKHGFYVLAAGLPIGLLLAWGTVVANAEDWPEFRGPTGQGLSVAPSLPVKWDLHANVRWKVLRVWRRSQTPGLSGGFSRAIPKFAAGPFTSP